jgi:hypothetical protein
MTITKIGDQHIDIFKGYRASCLIVAQQEHVLQIIIFKLGCATKNGNYDLEGAADGYVCNHLTIGSCHSDFKDNLNKEL